MNTITIHGNVTRDPELKYTPNNMAIAKFSVASSHGKDDKKKTTFIDIVVFGDQAETVCEQVKKGTRVAVVGRLQIEPYEKQDGTKMKRVEVIADDVAVSLRFASNTSPQRNGAVEDEEQPF